MNCPNCNAELSIIFRDGEEYDGKYFAYYEGECEDCGMKFEWSDIYEYTETTCPTLIDDHL